MEPPHRRPRGWRILITALPALLSAQAVMAQTPYCRTARSICPVQGMQPPGTQCSCPDHPDVWGIVGALGPDQRNQTTYPEVRIYPDRMISPPALHRHREELRNDDLDEGDDVLAGPRYHPRRHYDDQ